MCSWDETKTRLESVMLTTTTGSNCNDNWMVQLQQCVQVLGGGEHSTANNDDSNHHGFCLGIMKQEMQELQESSRRIRESLDSEIDLERQAFAEESNDLQMIVQQSNELQRLLSEHHERIAQLEDTKVKLHASVHRHKETASKQTEEMDQVELDRMQQVPKIKNQISLYAKTTGIKWDYHRDHVLAGQVVSHFAVHEYLNYL